MENFILIGVFVALGMVFRRLEAFPKDTAQVLNMFALYVSLPALILLKVPQLRFTSEILVAAVVPWAMLLLSIILILAVARQLRWSRSVTGALLLIVPLGNTSFFGVPMIQAFFGEAGIPFLIIYDQIGTILIFATYGSLILALYGSKDSLKLTTVVRRVLFFPPSMALFFGLATRAWPYPQEILTVLGNLSGPLVPLVMTAIGFQLRVRLPRTVLPPLGFGLGIKLLIAPLVALLGCRLLGLTGLAVDVTIFEAGMPPMVTAGALAVAAGLETELAVALVSLGMVAAFASLPLLYLVI